MNFLDRFKSEDPNQMMSPDAAMALMGIGQGMMALGNGQSANLAPYAQAIQQRRGDAKAREAMSGALENSSFTPEQRSVLASMPPELAQKIIAAEMFKDKQGQTKGVSVGGNLVNPLTGEVIYEGPANDKKQAKGISVGGKIVDPVSGRVIYEGEPEPAKPNNRFIEGVGIVDMNNPPEDMAPGQYQGPAASQRGISVGGNIVDPVTGKVIYEGPQEAPKPKHQYIEGVGIVDMNNPPAELQPGQYQPPQGGGDTEAEREIARMEEIGIPRDVAIRIKEGVYKVVTDPVTREVVVIDLASGQPVFGGETQTEEITKTPTVTEPIEPPPPQPDKFPDAPAAFGLEGIVKGGINSASDFIGAGQPYPEVSTTQTQMNVLGESLLSDLSSAYTRPPVHILKKLDELIPRSGRITGAEGAANQFKALLSDFETEMDSATRQLRNRALSPKDKSVLEARITTIAKMQAKVNGALSALQGGGEAKTTSSGVKWKVVD